MGPQDDFVHISTDVAATASTVGGEFFTNASGKRWFTEGVMVQSIRDHYPKHHLTVTNAFTCDLLAFGSVNEGCSYTPHPSSEVLIERQFVLPSRRYNDENGGVFADRSVFGINDFVFRATEFLIFVVEGQDGSMIKNRFNYILVAPSEEGKDMTLEEKTTAQQQTDGLIAAATKWGQELHNEVLVFDNGMWQKNKELWENVQKSNWEDVILGEDKKDGIINDVLGFFEAKDRYKQFGVPWKVRSIRSLATTCEYLRDQSLRKNRAFHLEAFMLVA